MNRTDKDLTDYSFGTRSSSGTGGNLMYLLIGGGIGATLALLFAPKSGSELRQDIGTAAQRGYDETLELAGKLRDQSGQLYDSIKGRADQLYGYAADKLNLEGTPQQFADQVIEQGKQLAEGAMDDTSRNYGDQESSSFEASKPLGNIH